ncbi:MAG: hypothetical protein JNK90_03525 [Planctomycetaceae bacterium]|nr:hypothetical protein [Planctomycetaceae bacterium]
MQEQDAIPRSRQSLGTRIFALAIASSLALALALITEIRQRFDDAFPVSNLSIIGHHN